MDFLRPPEPEANEPDSCRICREPEEGEPLFHPCRCSGSIRHVHQSCLISWLSHSQKRHCELCHTMFQFTRVYDPHMPEKLPSSLFIRQLALHATRSCLSWLRVALVIFVWVALLPYTVRFVWRALFWSVDGKWPVLFRNETRSSVSKLSGFMSPQTSLDNMTNDFHPSILDDVKPLSLRKILSASAEAYHSTLTAPNKVSDPNTRVTFLSDVWFLNNWTRFSLFNNILLDIIEGQILTLAVVVTFIVLFLIREWVIQRPLVGNMDPGAQEHVVEAFQRLPPEDLDEPDRANVDNNRQAEAEANAARPRPRPRPRPQFRRLPQRERRAIQRQVQELGPADFEDDQAEQRGTDENPSNSDEGVSGVSSPQQTSRNTSDRSDGSPLARESSTIESPGASSDRLRESASASPTDAPRPEEAAPADLGLSSAGYRFRRDPEQRENQSGRALQANLTPSEAHAIDERFRHRFHITDDDDEAFTGTHVGDSLLMYMDTWRNVRGNSDEFSRVLRVQSRDQEFRLLLAVLEAHHANNNANQAHAGETHNSPAQPGAPDPSQVAAFGQIPAALRPSSPPRSESMINFPPSEPSSSRFGPMSDNNGARPGSARSSAGSSEFDMGYVDRMVDIASNRPTDADQAQAQHPASDDAAAHDENDREVPGLQGAEDAQEGANTAARSQANPEHETQAAAANADAAVERKPLLERLADFFWGNIPAEANHRNRRHARRPHTPNPDPVNEAADVEGEEAADLDAEDIDDLDGLMELIGMRGPLYGLLQNSVFCCLLISFTLATGVWIPYIWGKLGIVLFTDPLQHTITLPFTIISSIFGIILDSMIAAIGYVLHGFNLVSPIVLRPISSLLPDRLIRFVSGTDVKGPLGTLSSVMVNGSSKRLRNMLDGVTYPDTQVPVWSIVSHHALRVHEARIFSVLTFIFESGKLIYEGLVPSLTSIDGLSRMLGGFADLLAQLVDKRLWSTTASSLFALTKKVLIVLTPNNWASLATKAAHEPVVNPTLGEWSTMDRFITIVCGNAFLGVTCLLYHRFWPDRRLPGQPRSMFHDAIREASGVGKVVFIIGIEMLAFPLYCGVLLDFALLPLFKDATVLSRIAFSREHPVTSTFIHWFVGTCYMFHFALFVSMCRKIMRSGVLYFIRDPDDPTFHPVRDVLDRNVSTQLRKIAFSGLFYVGLIVICIGGIMWSMAYLFTGIFPLHLSVNEPLSRYPIDLLVYILVMPALVARLRLSDFLTDIYEFWFRCMARQLRLTEFLVGTKAEDEEGHYVYSSWLNYILRRPEKDPNFDVRTNRYYNQHLHHHGHRRHHHQHRHQAHSHGEDGERIKRDRSYKFVRDGKYVRAPATDQVRVPRGTPVFLEVDRKGRHLDGRRLSPTDFHSSNQYARFHLPPRFKLRIFLFTFSVWMFAAVTGVMATVMPLLIGRWVLAASRSVGFGPINDISSFNIGMFIVGGIFLVTLDVALWVDHDGFSMRSILRHAPSFIFEIFVVLGRMIWLTGMCGVLLPMVIASLLQLYVMIPLNTYATGRTDYSVHLVHDWALGLLLVRIAITYSLRRWPRSHLSAILRAVFRDNPIRPDNKLIMRAFVLPALLALPFAVSIPPMLGSLWNLLFTGAHQEYTRTLVYRYSYPGSAIGVTLTTAAVRLSRKIRTLKTTLRNDFYQVGEQLRNRDDESEYEKIES